MAPYTIIDIFQADDEGQECWIGNYEKIEDAKSAFMELLKDRKQLPVDASCDELFDRLLGSGSCYHAYLGSEEDWYFIRHEDMKTRFDLSDLPIAAKDA